MASKRSDSSEVLVPDERITQLIRLVRGQKVILDADLARRLEELEQKYDTQFNLVFEAIRELMKPTETGKKRPIGFEVEGK